MSYMFVNVKNKIGMTVDPTEQIIFNQNIGSSYLGLDKSVLCATGNIKYNNSILHMLNTINNTTFANSLYLGTSTVGANKYNMLIILPEAQFNITPISNTNNFLTVYKSLNSLFYVSVLTIPSTTNNTNSEENSTYEFTPENSVVTYSKVNMSISNVKLF